MPQWALGCDVHRLQHRSFLPHLPRFLPARLNPQLAPVAGHRMSTARFAVLFGVQLRPRQGRADFIRHAIQTGHQAAGSAGPDRAA
jgi:hypothetical protein